jgi:hypothetical protein
LLDAASQRRKDRAGRAGRAGGGRLRHDQRNAAVATAATVAALAEQWYVLAVGRANRPSVGRPIVAIVRRTVVLDRRAAIGVRRGACIVEWGVERFDAGRARAAALADPASGFVAGFDRTGTGLGFVVGHAGRPGRAVHRINGID